MKREHFSLPDRERIELGKLGEATAAAYLRGLGYDLLESNHRVRQAEADLILMDGGTLVFCEVKTKRSALSGHALESYGTKQQKRLRRLVLNYLRRSGWAGPLRIDLMGLQKVPGQEHFEVNHIKDALTLEDNW